MRKIIILIIFLTTLQTAKSQQPTYKLRFDMMFDNLENSDATTPSRTKIGIQLSPELGLRWSKYHNLYVGANLLQYIGDSAFLSQADYAAYYLYNSPKFTVVAGSFSRKYLQTHYPNSFLGENYDLYLNYLKGALFNYHNDCGYAELFNTWDKIVQTPAIDEFKIAGSSEFRLFRKHWIVGANVMLKHFKNRQYLISSHLFEMLQYNIYTGLNLQPWIPEMDALEFTFGTMSNTERLRSLTTAAPWINKIGWQANIKASIKRVTISNITFWGEPQFSYYQQYGSRIYDGSPFYNSNFYDRLETSYTYKYKFLTASAAIVFHITDKQVANQQIIRLAVNFDDILSRK